MKKETVPTKCLGFKVHEDELRRIRGAAQLAGFSVSSWGAGVIANAVSTQAHVDAALQDVMAVRQSSITDKMRDKHSSVILREIDEHMLDKRAYDLRIPKSTLLRAVLICEADRIHKHLPRNVETVVNRARTAIRDHAVVTSTLPTEVYLLPELLKLCPDAQRIIQVAGATLAGLRAAGSYPAYREACDAMRTKNLRNLDKLPDDMPSVQVIIEPDDFKVITRLSEALGFDESSIVTLMAIKAIKGAK